MKEEEKLNYATIINNEKYKKVNDKITLSYNEYYNIMIKNSYEFNYMEQVINSYIPHKNINLKQFIENQQLLIKDLVNIINNILLGIRIHSNKQNSKKKNPIRAIIRNNNTNINYIKNFSKTNEENNSFDYNLTTTNNNMSNLNDNNIKNKTEKNLEINIDTKNLNNDLVFLNIKIPKKKNKKINQYINRPDENIINFNLRSKKKELKLNNKSSSTTHLMNKTKNNKSFISKDLSFLSNTNNEIINTNTNINANANRNKSNNDLLMHNKKKIKIKINRRLKRNNSNKTEILNTSSYFTNINEKSKRSTTCKSQDKYYNYLTSNNINMKLNNSKIPLKTTEYSLNKIYIPSSTFNDSVSEDIIIIDKGRYKNIFNILRDKNKKLMMTNENKLYYQIKPNRMTKELLDVSHSIVNKFEQKRKKNTSLGKRSKSLLI